ncbi:acyl-CoA thioesterase [Cesiribacter sp. SM1]|uniref:acyl-CoA thioesterase n=1 Tax=Cesiribacter sp. SM1 TaxID=2861196 RepID=UPI001CD80222|nr:acyl-CoA thioesterase [Cesiribacter sp. SM1]
MQQSLDARPVSASRTTLTELMIPSYANFGGKIHGGILLSLMDKVAYACASKHSGAYCVTVSVDNVDFMQPVEVGELISLNASMNYVGKSSMVVGIRVTAENVKERFVKHTNTSYFTMVAKDEEGRPFQVPPLILETQNDVRRFIEARERRRIYFQSRELMQKAKQAFNLQEEVIKLEGERCVLQVNI